MTTENTNFEEMTANAVSHIDETLDKNTEDQEGSNPYKLTQALLKEGCMYDDDGAYFHFKEDFQLAGVDENTERFETKDDIYLFVSRNPDKKLEINLKWARKTPDGFEKARGFNIDFLLDIGDEKDLKTLNKKVSFSGRKNGNPASTNTYVEFVEHFTDLISGADCLDVFKDRDYIFPDPADEENDNDVELEVKPQTFADYPEKIQHEALDILNNGSLFNEMQRSVALTHEGHKTTRNALLLMESSLFVDNGAHGLLGGESGQGKTDLALTCAMQLPAKNVHVISSNSPKNIFYDFENYDDDFNIVIFDDIVLNDELIALCKLLTDNKVKEKVHKTVINGKPETFKLKGKYEVILTYAKDMTDEELANRLFNIGVNIVDKGESKDDVKYKILDNNIIKADENSLIAQIREPIRAGVQYLIEQKARVYNPYLSMFDPLNFNNRDINHLVSMTNARTFFELNKRKQVRLNDETVLTIGNLADLQFVYNIWARDGEAQKYKLSELQKKCLDLLPVMTDKEAFEHVEQLNNKLTQQSREYKKKLLDDEPLLKSLAKKLGVNPSTLKHALDRFTDGNKKSLLEIGLVDKIQIDEDNPKSPNFYYKIKVDGDVSNSTSNYVQDMQISFADVFNSSIVKRIVLIDLLIYANIIVNERGGVALENYCNNIDVELDADNYNDMIKFIQGFFDVLDYEKHCIEFDDASREHMLKMFELKDELVEMLKKNTHPPAPAEMTKICTYSKEDESAQNSNQSKKECANSNLHILHIFKNEIKGFLEEKHIDVEIACDTYTYLQEHSTATTQDIVNYIHETIDPDDFNNDKTPLKINTHLNRMFMHDLLEFNAPYYELTQEFIDLVGGEQ